MAEAADAEILPEVTSLCNWFASEGQVDDVQKPVNGLRASKIWLRANSQAEPWNWFVPDLVTMLTTEPRTFPFCASLLFVCTLNSLMVSAIGGIAQAPLRSSVSMI